MPGRKPKKPCRGSETGFIFPEDGLHKAMADLPWPILKDMLSPSESKPSETPPEEPREPIRVIDPEDGFHKAVERMTPEQWSRFITRVLASPPVKAKTPSKD